MQDIFPLFYQCSGVSTDTRKIEKDCLFIALKGDNFDGNLFVHQALENGAKFAITDNEEIAKENDNAYYVEDSLLFLQRLAEHHRKSFDIPVIGITGSNGKTTSKELIAAVLKQRYNVLYTEGNLNNHIGVPLTILQITKDHEIAIIEMGASKLGDIKELTDIAHPTHGIITNIGEAHILGFGSVENIIKTKSELFQALNESKGHVVYNLEDQNIIDNLPEDCSYTTYSATKDSDIKGELINLTPLLNFTWKSEDYTSPTIHTKIIGKYNFYNMLAAVSFGKCFGVDEKLIDKALEEYLPTNNRSQLEETANNLLILDAYNANPTSVRSAVDNFANIETDKNKLFVLGDMLELGSEEKQYHREVIQQCSKLGLQGVFVGKIFKSIESEYPDILAFESTEDAKNFFKTASPKDNLILLKGSRGIGLEKLVEVL